jgi:hypothetical protein
MIAVFIKVYILVFSSGKIGRAFDEDAPELEPFAVANG